jgi:hypothetical protein
MSYKDKFKIRYVSSLMVEERFCGMFLSDVKNMVLRFQLPEVRGERQAVNYRANVQIKRRRGQYA